MNCGLVDFRLIVNAIIDTTLVSWWWKICAVDQCVEFVMSSYRCLPIAVCHELVNKLFDVLRTEKMLVIL